MAVDDVLIAGSPVRRKHLPVVEPCEKPVWNPDRVRRIVDAAPAEYRSAFVTMAVTGVRIGELLALQWKQVDFDQQLLWIRQSLWRGQLVQPKTKESVRRIPFGTILTKELRSHLERSLFADPTDFVFCTVVGAPLDPNVLRKEVLYPILDRLQIPRTKRASGFYGFRHAATSFINDHTGDLKLTQKFLGHADLSTTADRYTHVFREADRTASDALEQVVFGESVPSCSQNGNN